jgi:hypothetical protein
VRRFIIGLVAGAVLATTAAAVASIPSSDGVFTACVKSDGTLRLIDAEAGDTCKASEQTVTWNQTGPQGPPGVSEAEVITEEFEVPANSSEDGQATCPAGKKAISGGFDTRNVGRATVIGSMNNQSVQGGPVAEQWTVAVENGNDFAITVDVQAVCVLTG